jgi:hypothetical protein
MTSYCWKRSVKNIVTSKTFYGSWLNAGSLFFYKTRVQISSTDFYTLFFSFAPPRIAQERRLGFKSVVSPVKRLNALRAAYGLLSRFAKSGAFAMTVWIAMPQPIAANFHCASAILTEALPAGFIASDSCVLYRLNHFEKTKGLVCKVVLDLELGATARFSFVAAEAVREYRYDISALAFADPLRFAWFCFWVFLYHCQFSECSAFQINEGR